MAEIIISFMVGMLTVYLLQRPYTLSLETLNKELRGSLYERVGYRPWKVEKPLESHEAPKKIESQYTDLLEEQRKARESD
jgi:hypothetical protein